MKGSDLKNKIPMPHTKEDELVSLLKGQGALLQEVYSILEQEEKQDELARAAIRSNLTHGMNHAEGLDPARIFNAGTIRTICIKYRLRFLPSGHFKGEIPHGAVRAVRHMEDRMGRPARGFMVLAPSERFRLCDCDADPMLFVPVGNGRYYLLHRWGRDMHPLRAALGWPVRNWPHLVATASAAALLLGALVPTAWISTEAGAPWWSIQRFGAFFCIAMLTGAVTSYCWWAFFGQFSKDAWNSKTFN